MTDTIEGYNPNPFSIQPFQGERHQTLPSIPFGAGGSALPSINGQTGSAIITEGPSQGLSLEDFEPRKNATGGAIPNQAGVDSVSAMLSGGEFVMNAAATQRIGTGKLEAMNSGSGLGGETKELTAKLDELIQVTQKSSGGDINITINGSGKEETNNSDTTKEQREFSQKIKTAVKQVIADEQRLGGQLRV